MKKIDYNNIRNLFTIVNELDITDKIVINADMDEMILADKILIDNNNFAHYIHSVTNTLRTLEAKDIVIIS